MPTYRNREEKSVTLVVIPHHGASLFQWRLPRFVWLGIVIALIGLLGAAGYVVSQHIHYRYEIEKLTQERAANRRLASELGKGSTFIVQLPAEVRAGAQTAQGSGRPAGPSGKGASAAAVSAAPARVSNTI